MKNRSSNSATLELAAALALLLVVSGCALPEDVDGSVAGSSSTSSASSPSSVSTPSAFSARFLSSAATSDSAEPSDATSLDLSKLPENEEQFDAQF